MSNNTVIVFYQIQEFSYMEKMEILSSLRTTKTILAILSLVLLSNIRVQAQGLSIDISLTWSNIFFLSSSLVTGAHTY